MVRLEELKVGARVRGLSPTGVATVKAAELFGEQRVQILYLGFAQMTSTYALTSVLAQGGPPR